MTWLVVFVEGLLVGGLGGMLLTAILFAAARREREGEPHIVTRREIEVQELERMWRRP